MDFSSGDLLGIIESKITQSLALNPNLPSDVNQKLLKDKDPKVKGIATLVKHGWKRDHEFDSYGAFVQYTHPDYPEHRIMVTHKREGDAGALRPSVRAWLHYKEIGTVELAHNDSHGDLAHYITNFHNQRNETRMNVDRLIEEVVKSRRIDEIRDRQISDRPNASGLFRQSTREFVGSRMERDSKTPSAIRNPEIHQHLEEHGYKHKHTRYGTKTFTHPDGHSVDVTAEGKVSLNFNLLSTDAAIRALSAHKKK